MMAKKIACIGSGSLFFVRAIPDILLNDQLAGSELVLYDIDHTKSQKMAAMGQRLVSQCGVNIIVRSTESLSDAVDGADFAVTSIGGAGAEICRQVYDSQYHNADVRIAAKYGIQQVIGDTCGPAGMMMALRSIPAYLEICAEMEKRCPKVVVLNHSNPMAVLCRAMHKYTNLNVIGICHGVQLGIALASELLGLPTNELEYNWVGTNHYYWFTSVTHKGRDVYAELKKRLAESKDGHCQLSGLLSNIYDYNIVYTSDDHVIEFYPFLTQIQGGQKSLPYELIKSAKEHGWDEQAAAVVNSACASEETRKEFFSEYDKLLLDMLKHASERDQLPEVSKVGDLNSVYIGEDKKLIVNEALGALIGAISSGSRKICVANIQNKSAIPNLPYDAEVEVEAVTGYGGVKPVHMGEAPRVLKGILEKRFVWQDLVADAAVKGDRNLVLQALMLDEMAIWPDKAQQMRDELLTASKTILPQFFK